MKYTIVYSEIIRRGTMTSTTVKCDRVETNNLVELIKKQYDGVVNFIFESWPKLEGEE